MYPFERFTDLAKKTLTLAQEEAERSRHTYIGTEHLLLGLMRVESGTAYRILSEAGIEIAKVRETIEAVLGRSEQTGGRQIVPTSRVKRVIELAFEQSRQLNRSHVGTGEMLLALLVGGEGVGARVLKDLGLTVDDVRERVAVAPEESGEPRVGIANPGPGARVLVHDPEPPHRLWEGRVVAVEAHRGDFVIEVADRPAGGVVHATLRMIHPVPTGPTFSCRYCQTHL